MLHAVHSWWVFFFLFKLITLEVSSANRHFLGPAFVAFLQKGQPVGRVPARRNRRAGDQSAGSLSLKKTNSRKKNLSRFSLRWESARAALAPGASWGGSAVVTALAGCLC